MVALATRPELTQKHRQMGVQTPLGADAVVLVGLKGVEEISRPFRFELEVVASNGRDVPFEQLLGQPIGFWVRRGKTGIRHFHGICSEVRQKGSDEFVTRYQITVVPKLWLLTKRAQSRIFQHLTVVEILQTVLKGIPAKFEIQGAFKPRDYCVQYRETDFDFASRLMEEEGIYYFFTHAEGGHEMVLGNTAASHRPLPGGAGQIPFEEMAETGALGECVGAWSKRQTVGTGKFTLWDYCFEMPESNLASNKAMCPTVQVGKTPHQLGLPIADALEVYDWPGGYAQRFDGVDKGGGAQADKLKDIFADNARTVALRMEEEAATCLRIEGNGTCPRFTPGHKFSLTSQPGNRAAKYMKAEGDYVVTLVRHEALEADFRSAGANADYRNNFECIPAQLAFRPARSTERPTVQGTQTAVVVGPKGEEIFTDMYGRVKVQFPWDRQGKRDADSSCWIRVSQVHAGKKWGGVDIPRVGEEVIVAFEEGDPDRPIVIGRVYNATNRPPTNLPAERMISGLKSNTYPGGGGFNQILMNDSKGKELMDVNAQYDMKFNTNHDRATNVGNDSAEKIGNNRTTEVGVNSTEKVGTDLTQTVGNNMTVNVGNNLVFNAGTSITLKCGAATIHMNQAGFISITGTVITSAASVNNSMVAPLTEIAGGVMLTAVGGITMVEGGVTHIGGGKLCSVTAPKVDVVGGQTLIQGAPIKLN